MKFEIKHAWENEIRFSIEGDNWKLAFEAAVKRGQSFDACDLSGKDFTGVQIKYGEFYNSKFYNSKFDNSKFYNSKFYNSKFYNSKFDNSKFDNSKFDNSTFDKKSFAGLPSAWLIQCRDDLWSVLLTVPAEVAFLRKALMDGKVNGSSYTGECACLVGTISHARKCDIYSLGILKPNASRPAEQFFLNIREGGTPKKNPFAKLAVDWIDQWVELQRDAAKVFGGKK